MLRGSRHDGIPNNQSAKERDRQRERQRQERAQMLPNDDKDVTANSQDLFLPPCKVKPSVEDQTSLVIKSLGNYESVRHLMLDNSRRLIGVDQHGAGVVTPSVSSGSSISTNVDKQQRLPLTPGGSGSTNTVINKTSSLTSHRNFIQGPVSSGIPSSSSNTSSPNLFRPSSNPVQKVLLPPQPQALLPPPAVHHINQVLNSTHSHSANSSSSSSLNFVHLNPPLRNLNNTTTNYMHTNNSSASSSEVLREIVVAPGSENIGGKLDRSSNSSSAVLTDKSVRSSVPSAGVPNDKNFGSVTNNKPALERADSQLELESMLREMMDVKPPLTAIQTPLKETPSKKFSQRRSSKEENTVLNTAMNSTNTVSSPKSSKMDSSGESSSNESSSESDSEDSSSGSQAGGDNPDKSKIIANTVNSPTRFWDLSSIMENLKKDNKGIPDSSVISKSPKDAKLRKNLHGLANSEDSPQDVPIKTESSVTSTSVFAKSQSSSPLELSSVGMSHVSKVPGKSPRRTPESRPDSYIPAKLPIINPVKGISSLQAPSQGPSLSGSSSEDEPDKSQKDPPPRIPIPEPRPPAPVISAGAGKKRRKKSSSSSDRNIHKSEDDSSPETRAKSKKVVQDRIKNDMIEKLFSKRKKEKVESPSVAEKGNASSGTSSSGSSTKLTSSNRVSGKDNVRKSANTSNANTVTPPTSLVQNGELESSSNSTSSSVNVKKRESTTSGSGKDSSVVTHQRGGKRHQKSTTTITASSAGVTTLPPPASSVVRVKEDTPGKLSPTYSSLICRIPLNKFPSKFLPISIPTTPAPRNANLKPPPPVKGEKGGGANIGRVGHLGSREDSNRVRLHYDSSRVGSSSDHANDTHVQAPHTGPLGDETVCSDSDRLSANNHSIYKRTRRKSNSSHKKTKVKLEPDSHSKIDDDSTLACEVSSNVIGYMTSTYDPVLVSTSRTPPVEIDVAQAPDSSLNPPHLPSPVVQPQVQFYSYFDKIEHNDNDDYFTRGQEAYLDEAKRLKHKADRLESVPEAQASTYLEAGLYFILAGNLIERDRSVWSREAFRMYKDTLDLIRFIGNRFRNRHDNTNEAKITVLSLRCQSLLALKLFKMKMKETKDVAQYLNDHFQKTPPLDMPPMANSPKLSTPSPHSPTLSPAGSSGILLGLTPSPHHPQQNHQVTTVTVSRFLYGHMYKHVTNTMNLINAHETWDMADNLIEKCRIQEFFISIDRIYGPLTLHTPIMDLVRYVRHGLGVLKNCSDLS